MQISINQSPLSYTVPDNYTFTFTDNPAKQLVNVSVNCGHGKPSFPFTLWSGSIYSGMGDYTQLQVNSGVSGYLAALTTS